MLAAVFGLIQHDERFGFAELAPPAVPLARIEIDTIAWHQFKSFGPDFELNNAAEYEDHLLATMLEEHFLEDLRGEREQKRRHVLACSVLHQRLIVVTERGRSAHDDAPLIGAH